MKQLIGTVLAAAAGGSGGYAIYNLARLGDCAGACPDHVAFLPYLIGGIIGMIIATFVARLAFVVAPVVGLGVAGWLAFADGATFGPMAAFIAASVLLGPVILVVIMLAMRRKARTAQALVASGEKAIARIMGARETGVHINNRPQLEVVYRIEPLSGHAPFEHRKKSTFGIAAVPPRPGLAWPAWYDPADPSKVAIGTPSGSSLPSQELMGEFGLSVVQMFGYDPYAQPGQSTPGFDPHAPT